jgi:hypothetical protein
MRWCYYEFCNNKTEQLHGFVVKIFLPAKRSHFCRTICGRARAYLAISLDSLGFKGYFRELYAQVGMTMSSETERYFQQHDQKRNVDQNYANRRGADTKSVEDRSRRQGRGHTYRSRIAALTVTGTRVTTKWRSQRWLNSIL